jgi:hypothetical protein
MKPLVTAAAAAAVGVSVAISVGAEVGIAAGIVVEVEVGVAGMKRPSPLELALHPGEQDASETCGPTSSATGEAPPAQIITSHIMLKSLC